MKSLTKQPTQSDLLTLSKYEASRNIRATRFSHAELSQMTLKSYVAKKGIGSRKDVTPDNFDQIIKFKRVGDAMQAVGLVGNEPTLLILE